MSLSIITFVSGWLKNNSYLLYDEAVSKEAILIDPSESYEQIRSYISTKQLYVSKVFLTHGHFDHVLDVPIWKNLGAKIYMHKDDLANINSQLTLRALSGSNLSPFTIDVFFVDGQYVDVGFGAIHIMHTPGHTKGSCSFIIESNIFSGDTLFKDSYGRTDFFDGNQNQIIDSLKTLFSLNGEFYIYPGHDALTMLSYEKKNNPIKVYF